MKRLLIFTVAILLYSCATSYKDSGFMGGYSETQLDENVFTVSFHGNGYTSCESATDFTLLRSAELSLENGYSFFVIVDSESYTKNSTYTTPTTSNTTANIYGTGNSAYGTATTTTTGGQTYNISKPRRSNTIVCLKEKPDGFLAYNAKFVFNSISKKVRINT